MSAYTCRECGQQESENFYKTAKYYCKSCWNKRTAQAGKNNVQKLKSHYGGKCCKCGYNKCVDALEFHHLDPSTKEFHLGEARGYSLDKLMKEMDKCILVCRNCHAELHYDMKLDKAEKQNDI